MAACQNQTRTALEHIHVYKHLYVYKLKYALYVYIYIYHVLDSIPNSHPIQAIAKTLGRTLYTVELSPNPVNPRRKP